MLRFSSLRTRFILAYVGLIILGFGGLAAIAGQQLASAAREDYERQTINEVTLAARGIERSLMDYRRGEISASELEEVLAIYETQTDSELTLFLIDSPEQNNPRGSDAPPAPDNRKDDALPPEFADYPELKAAAQDRLILAERENSEGELMIYSAAPISSRAGLLGYIQSAEPASHLRQQISGRWSLLGLGVGVITILSLFASIALSLSLIHPLKKLQQAAVELSKGHLSYRVPPTGTDEVNAVALAFNNMADQLEAMIEEQRAFASNTSHELRTPLTTMRLRTEALRYDPTLDEETRTLYVQELDDEMRRMGGLIDDLILLSRLDAGRTQIGTDQIDLIRLMENLHRSFAEEAAAKQIDFRLSLPPVETGGMTIHASLNHLTILFRNLLENALKYTPAGGSVVWQLSREGDQIVSVIQDTGQGIEAENLPHVFDRFFRGDKAHTREIPGSGLGLSLVKAIADAYDARLEVQSAGKDQGSTVTVRWTQPSAI